MHFVSCEWLLVQFSNLLCSVLLCCLNLYGKYSLPPQAADSEHPNDIITILKLSITRLGLYDEVPGLGSPGLSSPVSKSP